MGRLKDEHERMAAVLHDVVEDTDVTLEDLTAVGCPADVLEAVTALSKLPGESQADYLARVLANPMALVVKRADIADNMSADRMRRLDRPTQERLRAKYEAALRRARRRLTRVQLRDQLPRRHRAVGVLDDLGELASSPAARRGTRPASPGGPRTAAGRTASGSCPTSSSCTPGGAAHQNASRSSWWWSAYMTNVRRTNQVGSPWLSFSVTSGRARHSSRSRGSGSVVMVRTVVRVR